MLGPGATEKKTQPNSSESSSRREKAPNAAVESDCQVGERKSKAREEKAASELSRDVESVQMAFQQKFEVDRAPVQDRHPGWRPQLALNRDSHIPLAKVSAFYPKGNGEPMTDFKEKSDN